jgi:hypothetical protein
MTDKPTVKFPVEMTVEQRDELDAIANEIGISRVAVMRIACREYAASFFSTKRLINKPIDTQDAEPVAA